MEALRASVAASQSERRGPEEAGGAQASAPAAKHTRSAPVRV